MAPARGGIWSHRWCEAIRQDNMSAAAEAKFRCRKSGPTWVRSYIPISRDEVDFLLASDPLTPGLRLSRQRPREFSCNLSG